MKRFLTIIAAIHLSCSVQAQLLVEHFAYNNGSLGASGVGSAVWSGGDSPSVAIQVNSTATLTNASLADIGGSGVVMSGGTFKKRVAPFTAQSSGSVYVSFLLNIQTAGSAAKAFIYLHDSTSATSSPELGVFLNGNDIGIGKKVSTPAASTTLSAGTHLIVAAYTFLAGSDRVDLWVDPTSLGTTNVPSATLTTTSGSDGTSLADCFFNHAVSQTIYVDELRIGTSWADVTPTTGGPPPPPSNPVITSVLMTEDGFVINGTNGTPNTDYDVVASTTMDFPVNQWPVIATDSFDTNGNFNFVNSIPPDVTQKFYSIHVGSANTNPPPPVAPTITTQPHDTTNLVGNTASFTVGATGTAPLNFLWYFNSSTPVSNGTAATLTLNNIQFSDAGGYSVIVSNAGGSVTSVVASLVVTNIETPPFITTQPQSQTVTVGQTANFSVGAGGSVPLYYQWYLDDTTPLADETNALLTLTSVTAGDAGGYSVIVSNAFGTTNSVTATLTVNTNSPPDFSPIGFCNDGSTITGGTNGPVVYVGSEAQLQAYSDVNPPYTIYITNSFGLSGMSTHIRSNKTVIGVGNIVLTGGGLYLYRSDNVIIRNLTISGSSEDDIGIHYSKRIWIDHCTLIDATDGSIDLTQSSDYTTISWCKFLYTVNSGHDFVNLIAASDADNGSQYHTTFHHNWWSPLCIERMPSVRFGRAHIFNNYYNAAGNNYCVRTRIEAECRIENNYFENVQNPWEQYITGASGTQGKAYAANNNVGFLDTSFGVHWTGTTTNKDATIRVMIPGTDTVFTPSYSYTLDNALDVKDIVINNAGAQQGPFAP